MPLGEQSVPIALAAIVVSVGVAGVALWWRRRTSRLEVSPPVGDQVAPVAPAAPTAVARAGAGDIPVAADALRAKLEPAAREVRARGVLVWWVASEGGPLQVLSGCGYPERFLAEVQPVGLDDPVLVAAACRERRPRVRARERGEAAAVAIPILRADDVLGVLSAELDPSASDTVSVEVQERLKRLVTEAAPLIPPRARKVDPRLAARPAPREAAVAELSAAFAWQSAPTSSNRHRYEHGTATAVLAPPASPSPPASPALAPAPAQPAAKAAEPRKPGGSGDEDESALREARSRFIAGFRKRSGAIDELIRQVESKPADGPLPALKQIVHRLASVAVVVGLPGVGARASELDALLEAPDAAANIAAVRRAYVALQEAFAADLATVPPLWAAPSGPAVGAHVLVVTSDGALAERAVDDLRQAAYRVTFVMDGQRALSVAQTDRPAVMLVDVDLKGDLEGHGVCRRIKADPALAGIPVVLLAAQASTLDRMAGFALGADDYLNKPLQVVEMLLRVRWMLTRPASERKPVPRGGGGLLNGETFLAAAREVLRTQPAALGLVRVTPGSVTDLAALFSDDLRRNDLLGSYTDTRLAVMLPGATAGVAARRILGVIDAARTANLPPTCSGVTATGTNPARYIEPLLAESEAALSSAQAQGLPVIIYGAGTEAPRGTVLIVDEDPEVVHIIDARLKAAGLQTMVAFDGSEALQRVEAATPAVVVLELVLPKRSGFDVLSQLRGMPEPRPKVIVVSSRSREEDVVRAFELGADDYLTKPFNPEELLARASRLLQ